MSSTGLQAIAGGAEGRVVSAGSGGAAEAGADMIGPCSLAVAPGAIIPAAPGRTRSAARSGPEGFRGQTEQRAKSVNDASGRPAAPSGRWRTSPLVPGPPSPPPSSDGAAAPATGSPLTHMPRFRFGPSCTQAAL